MTMKIDKNPMGGYTLSIGTGKLARAHDLQEVAYALMHYFRDGMPEYESPFNYQKHLEHNREFPSCPFCREGSTK